MPEPARPAPSADATPRDLAVTRSGGARIVALAYGMALAVALLAGGLLVGAHPVAVAAGADLAATLAVFAFSFAFRNSSLYDPYWSVAPVALALYWAAVAPASAQPLRPIVALALVGAWGARLTASWWRGWPGLVHEDWRYRDLRARTGRAYWAVSLFGIHLFPTVQTFLGSLALYPALTSARPLGTLDGLAAAVAAGAIALEAGADEELHRFRRSDPPEGAVLQSGLWSLSRHPNYLGEIGFWWGLWLLALAAAPGWWWTVVGPLSITGMFLGVSLPMIEERMHARRPAYAQVARRVPRLLPRLRPRRPE